MTGPTQPIATTYVEVRTARNAKQEFKRDIDATVQPAARGVSQTMQQAIRDGLRTPAGAAGAGAAIGTIVGLGISRAMAAAVRGGTSIFRTGIVEVKEYQAGLSQLQVGLRSTGNVAGLTAKQMEELAGAVEEYSGQTRDSIVRSESFLLTFDKIRDSVGKGNAIFTRTTQATADMAARFGGDASSKAILLGKALQDPQRGLVGLARAGVTFNDQQRKTIIALDKSGQSLEAQKLILAEVEKQVGGSAKAYGETLPGQVDRAHTAFENLSRDLLGHTAPALELAATSTRSVIDALDKVGPVVPILIGVGGALVVATKAVKTYREIRDTLFARQGERIAGNLAEARSVDAVAAAETRAGAAGLGRAGEGRLLQTTPLSLPAGKGGLLQTVGGATVGILLAGVTVAVDEALNRRGLDRSIAQQVAAAQAAGPQAVRDLAQQYGVTAGTATGQFIIDPKVDSDKTNAAVEALGRVLREEQQAREAIAAHLAQAGPAVVAAEDRLARSRSVLAGARAARLDPRTLVDNGVIGGAFDALPDRHPNNVADARDQLRAANQGIADAQRALNDARRGGAGASSAQLASAEASVLTARDAVARRGGNSEAEQLRLEAAEAHLSDLRLKGGTSADKIRQAEDKLAAARRDAGKATKDLHDVEKGTALTAADVLKRITGQANNARALREDSRTLVKKGVSEPVLLALEDLEKTAPGTLDNLAKSLTPAMAAALDKQQAGLAKATYEFHDAARVAGINDAIAAVNADKNNLYAKLAAAQIDRYKKALTDKLDREAGTTPPPDKPDPNEHGVPAGGPHVNRSQVPDPNEHGAPKAAPTAVSPVHLHVHGYGAQQVRQVAKTELDRADRQAAHMIGIQG